MLCRESKSTKRRILWLLYFKSNVKMAHEGDQTMHLLDLATSCMCTSSNAWKLGLIQQNLNFLMQVKSYMCKLVLCVNNNYSFFLIWFPVKKRWYTYNQIANVIISLEFILPGYTMSFTGVSYQ